MHYGYIYKITNQQNKKIYIGMQTSHRDDYLGGGKLIIRARQKYGKRFFTKEILGFCDSKHELAEAEIECINFFDSTNRIYGYNLSTGGESGSKGVVWNDEQRKTMSRIKKGHTTSQETRDKIGAKNKGKLHTEEVKLKMRHPKHALKNLSEEKKILRKIQKSEYVKKYWDSPAGIARRNMMKREARSING